MDIHSTGRKSTSLLSFLSLVFIKIASLNILPGFRKSVTMFQKVLMCCSISAKLLTARLILEGIGAMWGKCLVRRKGLWLIARYPLINAFWPHQITYAAPSFLPENSDKSLGLDPECLTWDFTYWSMFTFVKGSLDQFLQRCGKSCSYT